MNINHFLPALREGTKEVPPPTSTTWASLLEKRVKTFHGFLSIEAKKGLTKAPLSIHSARGQDAVRLVAFKVLEEMVESCEAKSEEHRKEEAIDAINYLLSLPFLDPEFITPQEFGQEIEARLPPLISMGYPLSIWDTAIITLMLCGQLSEVLRNRSWMEQTQDLYFSHKSDMFDILVECLKILLAPFDDWADFYYYYLAKDEVLQFRLRSHY